MYDRNYFTGFVVWVIERVSQLYKPAVAIYECHAVWICVNLCNLRKVAASIISQMCVENDMVKENETKYDITVSEVTTNIITKSYIHNQCA